MARLELNPMHTTSLDSHVATRNEIPMLCISVTLFFIHDFQSGFAIASSREGAIHTFMIFTQEDKKPKLAIYPREFAAICTLVLEHTRYGKSNVTHSSSVPKNTGCSAK